MTETDAPRRGFFVTPALLATALVALALLAIVVTALVLRYSTTPRSTAAEAACIDAASPASDFVVDESFVVDPAVEYTEGWQEVAGEIEPTMNRPIDTETSWVIGEVDDVEAVCIATFDDSELVGEVQFVEAALFDDYR